MTREEYLKCLSIMADLEGQWYRDEDGLYMFHDETQVSDEAKRAAELLNENYIEATREWERFVEMYGGGEIHMRDYNDENKGN